MSSQVQPYFNTVEDLDSSASKSNNMEMTTRHTNGRSNNNAETSNHDNKRGNSGRGKRELNRTSTLSEEYCFGHCGRLHQKLWFKILIFLFLSGLNIADLAADWLLYSDVAFTKEGLVYGPPGNDIIVALLVFSIIGSIVFLFEMINLGLEIFKNKGFVDIDVASLVTIWFEDIPQVALSVVIAACREEAISYFQLIKAAVVIVGVIIRIILTLLRYCSKKYLAEVHKHTAESCRHVTTRAFIVIGLLIMCTGSITVFIFTQTYRSADGTITFEVPENFIEGTYNDKRYFENVSMFFHHPSFDKASLQNRKQNLNWLQMDSIYSVRNDTDGDQIIRYAFTDVMQPTATVILADNLRQQDNLQTVECYNMDTETMELTVITCPATTDRTLYTQIVFRLHYIKQERLLLFGDIRFNVRVLFPNGTFENEAKFVNSIPGTEDKAEDIFGVIHYYRTNYKVESTKHAHESGTTVGFYKNDLHLQDITHLWKTGFTGCEPTGSLAPNLDTDVVIQDKWFF